LRTGRLERRLTIQLPLQDFTQCLDTLEGDRFTGAHILKLAAPLATGCTRASGQEAKDENFSLVWGMADIGWAHSEFSMKKD